MGADLCIPPGAHGVQKSSSGHGPYPLSVISTYSSVGSRFVAWLVQLPKLLLVCLPHHTGSMNKLHIADFVHASLQ